MVVVASCSGYEAQFQSTIAIVVGTMIAQQLWKKSKHECYVLDR